MTVSSILASLTIAATAAGEGVPVDMTPAVDQAATARAVAMPDRGDASEKICRTRFAVGQGLLNGMKTRKVCRTRAAWKAAGVDPG